MHKAKEILSIIYADSIPEKNTVWVIHQEKGEEMMKKITKMLVLALALVAAFSLGAGSTAEAKKKKKVTVSKVTSVEKVTGKKSITLTKGKTANLKTTVTVKPNKSANKKVKYKSSNSKVASVTSKGKITAKAAGSAKITVTSTKNSKKKATVKVKVVTGKVKKVTVTAAATTVKVGQATKVTAKAKTTGKKPNKKVFWKSSDESVATVDQKGNVTAKKAGTVKITAQATDGTKKKDSVSITVEGYAVTFEKKAVTVEATFADDVTPEKIQADLDAMAKSVGTDKEFTVKLDGNNYKAVVGTDGKVTINGKPVAESAKAKAAKEVTVKVTVDATKVGTFTAFAPSSVKEIKVNDKVTFSEVKADSVKVGDVTVGYAVDEKGQFTINSANGDVVAAFKDLTDAGVVTIK